MTEKLIITEPEIWCVLPHDGEYVLMMAGQQMTTFTGKKGDRISLHVVLPFLPPQQGNASSQ